MYQIDYRNPVHVHFCGIGGISMSGLASVLLGRGFTVTGSDSKLSELTDLLEKQGAKIFSPQCAENITPDIDVMVCTAAIHPDNPEYAAALSSGIPILTRAQLLGQIMDHYEDSVAISGTHGKTTVTSMISCILLSADLDPTISVGGILKEIGGNIRVGRSGHFVTEACEYTNSFLSLKPKIGIILNIDADHLDFFKDLDDIRHSFHRFAQNIRPGGTLILNAAIPHPEEITEDIRANVITYGRKDADYYASDITFDEFGAGSFHVFRRGEDLGTFMLHVPGKHNVSNAVCAIAAADRMGISMEHCRRGLDEFHGADRRFQIKGKLRSGATVIDDYAHHPTEIQTRSPLRTRSSSPRSTRRGRPTTWGSARTRCGRTSRTAAQTPGISRPLRGSRSSSCPEPAKETSSSPSAPVTSSALERNCSASIRSKTRGGPSAAGVVGRDLHPVDFYVDKSWTDSLIRICPIWYTS